MLNLSYNYYFELIFFSSFYSTLLAIKCNYMVALCVWSLNLSSGFCENCSEELWFEKAECQMFDGTSSHFES